MLFDSIRLIPSSYYPFVFQLFSIYNEEGLEMVVMYGISLLEEMKINRSANYL